MENFIKRCTQFSAAKLDTKDFATSLLKRQQFNNIAQQQQQQVAYDTHFQIVNAQKKNNSHHHQQQQEQEQQQTDQYSYKTCSYYHYNIDATNNVKQQNHFDTTNTNNNHKMQQHQTTDKNNNNFDFTTKMEDTTTYYRRKLPFCNDDGNYDHEWLTQTIDLCINNNNKNINQSKCVNNYDDNVGSDGDDDIAQQRQRFNYARSNSNSDGNDQDDDCNDIIVENDNDDDLYVAVQNDVSESNEKHVVMDEFLLPVLKRACTFWKSTRENVDKNSSDSDLHDDNLNNVNSKQNNNVIIVDANNFLINKSNCCNNGNHINNIAMTYGKRKLKRNVLSEKKQHRKYSIKNSNKNDNNKYNTTTTTTKSIVIRKTANALSHCRKNVLSTCNKTLKNLFTRTTMPTVTTSTTRVTLYKRKQQQELYYKDHRPHHDIFNAHSSCNKQRQQQQFRLLPSLGTTSFLTLLTLICLETLLLTTVTDCAKTFYMHWNTSNSIFRIDNTDHIIDVNKGNLAFEFDQVHIICPVYEPGTYENETEKYIIYNVSKVEYETCRITNADPRVIAICDKPQKLMFFTITFRPFTPQPGGLEFLPGNDYYFISTSSKDDLYRRIGGRCSTNNMKVVFKVCCAPEEKNKTNASTIGGGGSNNAGISSNMPATGIATSDTSTINMDNGGVGGVNGGGHQTYTTTQYNKNMQVIGVNTAIMPTGGSSGTNSPLKPIKNGGGVGGGTSINTNIDQFNRIPIQQQTHGINIIGNNMATSMGQIPHGGGIGGGSVGHSHGHPGLDNIHNNGINSAINVVVSGNGNGGNSMLTPNHGILPTNGIGISGYSNIGHSNGDIGGTGIRINNVPTQQYHPPYKQGNNNKLNTNGDEHHFGKHPNEVVKNEELTYNSAGYSLHKSSSTTTVVTFIWKFIWNLCKTTCHGFIHVYHKFNSQIDVRTESTSKTTMKSTNEHLINRNLNAFNCILTKNRRENNNCNYNINNDNFNTTKFQNSIVNLSEITMKRFCLSINQATLDVKYLFKNFHPILMLILILIILMMITTAYYQLNSISLYNHFFIETNKTTSATIENLRGKELSRNKKKNKARNKGNYNCIKNFQQCCVVACVHNKSNKKKTDCNYHSNDTDDDERSNELKMINLRIRRQHEILFKR